jgi:hypothetical protein
VTRWRRLARLACCATALAGCDKSPAEPPAAVAAFDAAAVESGLAIVNQVFGMPAIQSLSALGPLLTVPAASPIAPGAPAVACGVPATRTAAAAVPAAPRAADLIADSLFRRVFVYDTAARAYRLGADTSGPAGGIRFVLYTLNGYGLPVVPLSPNGSLDLTDQSAGTALRLRSRISAGTVGNADYLVALSGTQAADTALLAGTVTAGNHGFAFRDSTASAGFQVLISVTAADSADDLHVSMRATRTSFDPFDYNDVLDFSITYAAHTLRLAGGIDTYCLVPSIGLSVSIDGAAFATVTNGTTTPNVARVDGKPLTASESQAILDLKDAQRRLFAYINAFHSPAKALLPRN